MSNVSRDFHPCAWRANDETGYVKVYWSRMGKVLKVWGAQLYDGCYIFKGYWAVEQMPPAVRKQMMFFAKQDRKQMHR